MKKNVSQIKVGSLLTYLQMSITVIVGLTYTPLMIRLLGQSEFGLYNTVVSTISMLSILNLGFGSSYIRYYSKYRTAGDEDAVNRLNGLFMIVFSILGAVALACGLFLSFNLQIVFKDSLSAAEYGRARVLMILLSFSLCESLSMSVFQNFILANERFIFFKIVGIIWSLVSPLVTLPLLLMGFRSVALVVVTVSLTLGLDLTYLIYARKVLKWRCVFHGFERGLVRDLLSYNFFIVLSIIVDQINWNIDKIVLARYRGTIAVAVYSVGYNLYHYYHTFSYAISDYLTPRIHAIVNRCRDEREKMNAQLTTLFIRVGRLQFLMLALIASLLCFFGRPFIRFWAGEGYEASYYVALLLVLPSTIDLIQNLGIEIQRAQNLHRFRSIVCAVFAAFNLIVSIYLGKKYGAVGAAIGTAASLILANGFVMNIYYHRKCGLDIPLFWKNILRMSVGIVPPAILGVLLNRAMDFSRIWTLFIGVAAYVAVYCASMWLVAMNDAEKELVRKPLRKILGSRG